MIRPYVRTPEPPRVALLTADGTVLGERGRSLSLDNWPDGYRCWD